LKLVLCDDHRLFAQSLATVLEARGWRVAAVVTRPEAAVEAVAEHMPDICILDLFFGGDSSDAIAAAECIGRIAPGARVIMLSGSDEPDVVSAAIAVGVAGYALKTARIDTIISTIERIASGETIIDPELLRRAIVLQSRSKNPASVLVAYLTQREREALSMLLQGASTSAVADQMGIGLATARSHIQNVLAKLGVHSRLEAVALAVRAGVAGESSSVPGPVEVVAGRVAAASDDIGHQHAVRTGAASTREKNSGGLRTSHHSASA